MLCMHGCAENVDVCTAEWHNHTDQHTLAITGLQFM